MTIHVKGFSTILGGLRSAVHERNLLWYGNRLRSSLWHPLLSCRETEIKQLQGWKSTVENLVDKFQELITCRNERILAAASDGAEGGVFKEMTDVGVSMGMVVFLVLP